MDAEKEGLKDGDWGRLITPKGEVVAEIAVKESMKPGHIRVPHGWWYPEMRGTETLGGAFIGPVFIPLVRLTEAQRDVAALERSLAALNATVKILDEHLAASPWIGEKFSFADIVPGHLLYRLHALQATGELSLAPHPNVTRYYEALQARPAFAEHVMISFDGLRPK